MERVFGFEIMPAVCRGTSSIGVDAPESGKPPLAHGKAERVGVFLTNALTGWEPPKGVKATLPLPYPELAEEPRCSRARQTRHQDPLWILGNPPYNAFAGISPDEEQEIVEPYKQAAQQSRECGRVGNQEVQPR